MSDLVERLRKGKRHLRVTGWPNELLDEAADLIESLEAQLNQTLDEVLRPYRAKLEAIAALPIHQTHKYDWGNRRIPWAVVDADELEALLGKGNE